jgi:hypothetical protein
VQRPVRSTIGEWCETDYHPIGGVPEAQTIPRLTARQTDPLDEADLEVLALQAAN